MSKGAAISRPVGPTDRMHVFLRMSNPIRLSHGGVGPCSCEAEGPGKRIQWPLTVVLAAQYDEIMR